LKQIWHDFGYSIVISIICLALAGWWGASSSLGIMTAIWVTFVLGIMEVTLSFDNAVVNASVLKEMDEKWRYLFLTVGILVAVFGMRLVFPVLIVSVATGEGLIAVAQLALSNPAEYSNHLMASHISIASFGGMFLLLVFLTFLFDHERDVHWLGKIEEVLGRLGKLDTMHIMVALALLVGTQYALHLPEEEQLASLMAGIGGIVLFIMVDGLDAFFESDGTAKRSGLAAFLYLEVLDASFSFDGVIGAFAITQDVVIIMLGLGIGALFVRSLTVYLVNKGTLDAYIFLEHGAHYAIGALAAIMLISMEHEVPEWITGLIGLAFIVVSVISSIRYRNQEALENKGKTQEAG
jgi:hypothetical protein